MKCILTSEEALEPFTAICGVNDFADKRARVNNDVTFMPFYGRQIIVCSGWPLMTGDT
jgi:hypothetical protein